MKRLLFTGVIIALLIYPSTCVASYLIQLKNGKEFFISEYWEETNQVKFYYYGGVVSIEKDLISAIRESDVPYIEETLPVEEPEPAPAKGEIKAEAEAQKETAPAEGEKDEKEIIKKEIMEDLNLLKERFKSVYTMTNQELYKFAEDLMRLKDKILEHKLGAHFSELFVDIYGMGDEVEAILKSRGQ